MQWLARIIRTKSFWNMNAEFWFHPVDKGNRAALSVIEREAFSPRRWHAPRLSNQRSNLRRGKSHDISCSPEDMPECATVVFGWADDNCDIQQDIVHMLTADINVVGPFIN